MKKIKMIVVMLAVLAIPALSQAKPPLGQTTSIKITYSGKVALPGGAIGALRVTMNTGATYDYTTYPSSYDFSSAFTTLTFNFKHSNYNSWTSPWYYVTINKSTLDAQAVGSTVNYYMPNANRYYQVTKGPAYSVIGVSYAYSLDVKVREPYL